MSRKNIAESLIGRAVLYLIAAISLEVAFSDTSRLVGVSFDECCSRDQEMIDLVTTDLSPVTDPARESECLFPARRRIGQVKIPIPTVKRIVNSILTTPTSPAAVADEPTAGTMLPARSWPGTP